MHTDHTIHKPVGLNLYPRYCQALTPSGVIAQWLGIRLGESNISIHNITPEDAESLGQDIIDAVQAWKKESGYVRTS